MLSFNDYQKGAFSTAIYPEKGNNYIYPVLGLCGETGELAEKIKKVIRDHGGLMGPMRREAIKKELGDVLWYVAAICTELDFHMEDVAFQNLEKLNSRKDRKKIHGDGDER